MYDEHGIRPRWIYATLALFILAGYMLTGCVSRPPKAPAEWHTIDCQPGSETVAVYFSDGHVNNVHKARFFDYVENALRLPAHVANVCAEADYAGLTGTYLIER